MNLEQWGDAWDPRNNSEQALWLAVELNMSINNNGLRSMAVSHDGRTIHAEINLQGADRLADTRLAIVALAEELGVVNV